MILTNVYTRHFPSTMLYIFKSEESQNWVRHSLHVHVNKQVTIMYLFGRRSHTLGRFDADLHHIQDHSYSEELIGKAVQCRNELRLHTFERVMKWVITTLAFIINTLQITESHSCQNKQQHQFHHRHNSSCPISTTVAYIYIYISVTHTHTHHACNFTHPTLREDNITAHEKSIV